MKELIRKMFIKIFVAAYIVPAIVFDTFFCGLSGMLSAGFGKSSRGCGRAFELASAVVGKGGAVPDKGYVVLIKGRSRDKP